MPCPFFGGKDDEEENYEGVLNTSSRAMDLLKWIMEQPGFPPVYILITDFHSELMYNQTDRDALKKLGVAGFVRMDRSKINELSLDLFLSGKLSNLVSKGRILAHAIDYKQEGNGYSVKLREFSEKTSMDTEAAGIFVNDTSGKSENGFDKVIGAEMPNRL